MRDRRNGAAVWRVDDTHRAENVNDIGSSREKFGMTPAEYAEDLGWVGHDVWLRTCVQLDDGASSCSQSPGTGVAALYVVRTCGLRRASLRSKRRVCGGVPVGLGVEGSASNDGRAGWIAECVRSAVAAKRLRGRMRWTAAPTTTKPTGVPSWPSCSSHLSSLRLCAPLLSS